MKYILISILFMFTHLKSGQSSDSLKISIPVSPKPTFIPELKYIIPFEDRHHDTIKVNATYYNPVIGQCDNRPWETSNGSIINIHKLKVGHIKWIAVSRDLLYHKIKNPNGPFRLHDWVWVDSDNAMVRGWWQIRDKMGKSKKRNDKRVPIVQSIDFLTCSKIHGDIKTVNIVKNN